MAKSKFEKLTGINPKDMSRAALPYALVKVMRPHIQLTMDRVAEEDEDEAQPTLQVSPVLKNNPKMDEDIYRVLNAADKRSYLRFSDDKILMHKVADYLCGVGSFPDPMTVAHGLLRYIDDYDGRLKKDY